MDAYAQWRRRLLEPRVYQNLVQEILRREGLGSEGRIVAVGSGSSAIFEVPESPYLVKILSPFDEGAQRREVRALSRVAGVEGLAVPRVLGAGEVFVDEAHTYLIMTRLAGRSLAEARQDLSDDDALRLAVDLGALVKRLHRIEPEPVDEAEASWKRFVDERLAFCRTWPEELLLPPCLEEGALAFLAEHEEFLCEGPLVLLHADLKAEHILVNEENGEWGLSGIIDFGDSFWGPPTYDFVVLYLDALGGRRVLFDAFAEGYAGGDVGVAKRWLVWALLHRFPFLGHCGPTVWGEGALESVEGLMEHCKPRSTPPPVREI
ncbi:MAG: phosphotransferase family protein [Bradymonadaceae bacterium]